MILTKSGMSCDDGGGGGDTIQSTFDMFNIGRQHL